MSVQLERFKGIEYLFVYIRTSEVHAAHFCNHCPRPTYESTYMNTRRKKLKTKQRGFYRFFSELYLTQLHLNGHFLHQNQSRNYSYTRISQREVKKNTRENSKIATCRNCPQSFAVTNLGQWKRQLYCTNMTVSQLFLYN